MLKRKIEEAIYETQQCLVRYWQKDCAYAVDKLTPDIMWIGAVKSEFMQGKEEVTNDLQETNWTNPVCHMLQQEFWCIYEDTNTCIIAGRYLVTTDNESGEIIQEQQRSTFVWKLEKGKLFIAHMHISQPIGYLEKGELFPHKIGKMSYNYLQSFIVSYKSKSKSIKVKDINGHLHFLSEAEIEYAEAKDHNTIIGLSNLLLVSRIEWKDFTKELGKDFVKVHRSFVINCSYIKLLGTSEIEMLSGTKIPVPVKKRTDIYQLITSVLCREE